MYLRARHYDPATGRFLQPDPLSGALTDPRSLTPHPYALNNPVNLVDPSGELAWLAVFAVAWLAFEVGATLYDAYSTGATLLDPNASATEKALTTGLFVAGLIGPGGNYATAGKLGKKALLTRGVDDTTALWRAVKQGELASIRHSGMFQNPPGIEYKYFSTTAEGAERYGKMAYNRWPQEGPYTLVRTAIPTQLITPEMVVQVDRGIGTIVISTDLLPRLSPPVVVRPIP